MTKRWILASASPTRRRILESAGIMCEVIPADIDEQAIRGQHQREKPADIALRLARAKAQKISADHGAAFVLGADQILHTASTLIAKPASVIEAKEQLRMLRGGCHSLVSALSLWCDGKEIWQYRDSAEITMRDFSKEELENYLILAKEDLTSTPGACRIEGLGIRLIRKIKGDYFTILGLPLLPLLEIMRNQTDEAGR